jgi:hypothetical protein
MGKKNGLKSFRIEGEHKLIVANDELEGLATAETAVTAIKVWGGCRVSRTQRHLFESIYKDEFDQKEAVWRK